MTKQAVWAVESIVTVAVILGLVYTANFRYSRALVDPGLPAPDYALQASIAYVGIAVVIIIAAVLTLRLTRHPSPRAASAVGVAAIIISSGVAIAVVAMLLASI